MNKNKLCNVFHIHVTCYIKVWKRFLNEDPWTPILAD